MNVKSVYLDSSAIVKRYVAEKGSKVIDKIYDKAENSQLKIVFSIWNIGEVIGVVVGIGVSGSTGVSVGVIGVFFSMHPTNIAAAMITTVAITPTMIFLFIFFHFLFILLFSS